MDPRRRRPSTSHTTGSATNQQTTTSYLTTATGNQRTSYQKTSYETRPTTASTSTSNRLYGYNDTTTASVSRPRTGRRSTGRPGTAATARPRTGYSTLAVENQEIACAVAESRGVSPSVGLAFINLDTGEAVLSQLNDTQTYVKTVHKLIVYNPSHICMVQSAAHPKSKLFSVLEEEVLNGDDIESQITLLDRKYWNEGTGLEYIEQLAFHEDVESIKTAVTGNYFAVCCFAAALKYTELGMAKTFPLHSLRIKYEPADGSMMIDLSTIKSLELVQNLQMPKSRDCLFGLLNETQTPMGMRMLRSNILQPNTDAETLAGRYDAVEELSTKEQLFFSVRAGLKPFLDLDKILTQLILVPIQESLPDVQQSINNVIMLKHAVLLVKPVWEALTGARSPMLLTIQTNCASENTVTVQELINNTINEDTTYAKQPLDFRNQRTYAVKSGVNGLLDVARQTYKESMTDALQHISDLAEEHNLPLQTKFDNVRQFYLRLSADELQDRNLPAIFVNVYRKKDIIECQTMTLVKLSQKIGDAHNEVLLMSDQSVRDLIESVREHMFSLFRICESIAMLDMLTGFAHLVSIQNYVRPMIGESLAIRAGRHPIREKIHNTKFIPNDVYATEQTRFQVITGCNMSGKSTYIRSIALMTIMAQVGSFVPAQYAAFPIIRQFFARISLDDSIEANVSSFAAEMRETAFILRNIDPSSMVIIDELGRGTSTRDGIAIAIAIAEALVESKALVWFVTHFRDLAHIMSERAGVVSLHLAVDMSEQDRMEMLYRVAAGIVQEEHYGLKLARVVPLPRDIIEHAELVSMTLEKAMQKKKRDSIGVIKARRRKLLLNLKEHLKHAKNGSMDDETLRNWLKDLQKEFIVRMTALDDELKQATERGPDEDGGESTVEELDDVDDNRTASQGNTAEEVQPMRSFIDRNGLEHVDATTDAETDTGRSVFGDSSNQRLTTTS
ncbi:MutS 4 [Fulvia fulva]|uniref:MutS 4 n=1 Tax=Passalora fulva TaxID=5499 RepID=A0A9Q8LEJ7_PASFU|nr:MutS 4 [Fulvia fulva]UJO15955.1 MutS 4 [Fulvia fulva]